MLDANVEALFYTLVPILILIFCFVLIFISIASKNGYKQITELLINQGIGIDVKDNDERTALNFGNKHFVVEFS